MIHRTALTLALLLLIPVASAAPPSDRALQARNAARPSNGGRIRLELLSKAHGDGVLKLSASHLNDVFELLAFAHKCLGQLFDLFEKAAHHHH